MAPVIDSPLKTGKEIKTDVVKHLQTSAKDLLYTPRTAEVTVPTEKVQELIENMRKGADGGSASPPTEPSPHRESMTVQEFMQGDYLEPGDVVLMARLGSVFRWFVKLVDKSNFAHVALVFQTPRHTDGIDDTFLIETSMGGVDIVPLSDFLEPKKIYADTGLPPDFVLGVKRFEPGWARPTHRKIAASRMLHFIQQDNYNFRLVAALASPRTRQWYFRAQNSLKTKAPVINDFLKRSTQYLPREFICSSFVQYAYIDMVRTCYHRGLIEPDLAETALNDVIFPPNATAESSIEELMACTPKILSESEKLKWKFLIHNGEVFHVDNKPQVTEFFSTTLPKRIDEIEKRRPRNT